MQARFKVGTQFTVRSKQNRGVHTVTDIHTTYNSDGKLVGIRYVATHTFCGQVVERKDICETTIAMGEIKQ